MLYATYYACDDLAITVAVAERFNRASLSLGVEYDLPVENLTAFGEVMWAEDDYDHAMKWLIRREFVNTPPPNVVKFTGSAAAGS